MALTKREKILAAEIYFDERICLAVKESTGGRLTRFMGLNDEYEAFEASGLSVVVISGNCDEMLSKVVSEIEPHGYMAYLTQPFGSGGKDQGDVMAVLKTTDEFEIIRLSRSNGENYGVSTNDIVKRLKKWKKICQFQIVGASGSWVKIRFKTIPCDICAFAEDIYEFCPDTVEQDVGLLNEAKHPEKFLAARRLCPELSKKMKQKLKRRQIEIESRPIPPVLQEMLQSSGFNTTTDMGIRLLASHVKESHELFLWWD